MTPESAKSLAEFLLPQIQQEYQTTCKIIAAVPEAQSGYKPSEKCMSALELAIHLAASEAFFLNGVINSAFDWKQPEFKTPAEVLAHYQEIVPPLLAQVAQLPAEKLAVGIQFHTWNEPAVNYLSLHLRHSVHHRGQLSAYLRPMGAKVPSIYGPSADDPGQAAANG